ncbi:hypothetical protein CC80DRAFT_440853, partial [Byssothecium circinans]
MENGRHVISLCRKWGLKCEYIASSHRVNDDESLQYTSTLFGRQPFLPPEIASQNAFNMEYFTDNNVDLSGSWEVPLLNSYPTVDPFLPLRVPNTEDIMGEAMLPVGETLNELINIFFEHFQHRFPFFQKNTFFSQFQNGTIHAESELLLYAICTIASSFHPDPAVKTRQNAWYDQAKFLYEFTGRVPQPPLRTIQAALCLVFHAYTRGDFSACWLYVGKAWRQAASLGMNRADSSNSVRQGYYTQFEWTPKTAIEKEECRRTLWVLFMMDRNGSWPTGWPTAVDERHFKIDIPTTEAVFQAMTEETDPSTLINTPFTPKLNTLISSTSAAKSPLNPFHYLVIVHVLLGRVTELIHSLHNSPDTLEYAQECDDLDASLVKLRLSIPRSATSVLEASTEDRDHAVWLNLILNTTAILLHYRSAGIADPSTAKDYFARAVVAAENTAQIVKDTARISIDLLLSAHIASSIYIAGCVLVIHWRTTGDESCRGDIEVFELVFERMSDVFTVLGLKFKIAMKRDQERSDEEILKLREAGFKGLLADCSKW